ncbi:MAG TPA: hypothetical protein PLR28_10230 [Dokdonella sp.]|nr:hypothetical protein [Dokdonella sp.]
MISLHAFLRQVLPIGIAMAMTIGSLSAHEVQGPSPSAGLGALVFPTSANSHEAQAQFERAALLLHLFEYEDAAAAFIKAQSLEPDFVMAVWGEAMTHNHPLWNQLDEEAGRKALRKLGEAPAERAKKAKTAREKDYLSAVEILYSGSGNKVERDARYDKAMQAMATKYPDDDQAQLFHALALEGRSEGVRNVPDYLQAAAIAERMFRRNPQNPGAAHYWIHGMDDPEHAAGAIEAARALSKIAPDAGHAQHMTSHIFIALGLWDDLIQANEEAVRVVYAHARERGKPEVHCFHYNEWLLYGYFQQGRRREANALLLSCKRTGDAGLKATGGKEAATLADRFHDSLPTMRATTVIESEDWNGAAVQLAADHHDGDYSNAVAVFASGYAAAQRDDFAQATESLQALSRIVDATSPDGEAMQLLDYLTILRDDLDGAIAFRRGDVDAAIQRVGRAATRMDMLAFDFGPPVTIKPPRELLGEILLASGKPDDAAEEFRKSLKAAPNRALSLLGLARAEDALKDHAAAASTYAKLLKIWHRADNDLPAMQEARQYMAR